MKSIPKVILTRRMKLIHTLKIPTDNPLKKLIPTGQFGQVEGGG